MLLLLLSQDGLSSFLDLHPLATNKQTTLFDSLISQVGDDDQIMQLRTHRILLKKDYHKAMSTILLFRCHTVSQKMYLMLFLLFQDGLSNYLGLPPLATNKQTNNIV